MFWVPKAEQTLASTLFPIHIENLSVAESNVIHCDADHHTPLHYSIELSVSMAVRNIDNLIFHDFVFNFA